jgi:tryptophan-rich sensory protein
MAAAFGIVVWYLMFATSFVGAMISWQIEPVGQKPSWQGMFSYYGWAALLIAHLRILVWVRAATRQRVHR